MQRKLILGNTVIHDVRLRINPGSLIPLFARVQQHRPVQLAFDRDIKSWRNELRSINIVPNSALEHALTESAVLFSSYTQSSHFNVQPFRMYAREKQKEDMQYLIAENTKGVLCIARENASGGVFTNADVKRALSPVEMITWSSTDSNSNPTTPTISPLQCIEGIGECCIDLILFHTKHENKNMA